ncbi:Enolase-phosphatase E1 [Gryllus bimaculatus]|nr:Enolase-phosphatase E1 [Gryllus bimaculatus]
MIGTSEKRSQEGEEFDQKIKILIVDIEGTTTSISFVKDTLFPYIRENLKVYLKSHWKEPEFVEDLTLLRKQAESDKENGVEGLVPIPAGNDDDDEICQAVLNNILWQMDLDRKTKALKQLQGHVMREGYLNGKLKGHVYDDVQPALKSWKHSGRQVYVYSSGSVAAQKLLFEFSEKGDLLELFSGHFDTDVGSKIESSSYSNIAKQLNCKCEEIMFLTDIPKEAMAAQEAGLHPVLVVRPGNDPLSDDDCHKFRVIKSFDDIVFEASAKRTKLSVESTDNTVSSETSKDMNSSMQMDVDVDDSCPKVSEGATSTSDSQEKSEVAVVQNGNAQKENGEQNISGEKENKATVEERAETEPEKASKPKTDSNMSSKIEKGIEESKNEKNKVESPQKTENSIKEAGKVEIDVQTSNSSESTNPDETSKDKIVTEETKCDNEKMETDGCTLEKKSNNPEESDSLSSKETGKTAEETEKGKSDGSATETVIPEVAKDSKSVEPKTAAVSSVEPKTAAVSSVEPKTAADSSDEPKTAADSSDEAKTAAASDASKTAAADDASDKTKTAEVDKAKTAQTASKEKATSDVGEEKTVDSPCEKMNVDAEVKSTSKDGKDLKASGEEEIKKHETKVPEKIESKVLEKSNVSAKKTSEIVEKDKSVEIAEEAKETSCSPEVAEEVKASDEKSTEIAEEITEKVTTSEVTKEIKAPEVTEKVTTSEVNKEIKTPEVTEKVTTSDVTNDIKSGEIAEEKVSEGIGKAKIAEGAEEVKSPERTENTKVEKMIASEAKPLKSVNEALPSKAEKVQTTESLDEKMECEESKTDESTKQLKNSKAIENNAPHTSEKMEESGTEDSKSENVMPDLPTKGSEDSKRGECKSLENTEEKKVTESCPEKLTEKDNQDSMDKKNKIACTENGETDVEMETAAPDSSDKDQKVDNKISDDKVPKKDAEENKSSDNDSSAKNAEAMETDGQDSETVDKAAPMDVESTEINSGNEGNVEIKKEVESKTNGINNSHSASPAENDTNVKILDKESIKLKKNEESEAAKLITPPSVQS